MTDEQLAATQRLMDCIAELTTLATKDFSRAAVAALNESMGEGTTTVRLVATVNADVIGVALHLDTPTGSQPLLSFSVGGDAQHDDEQFTIN